MQIRLFQPSDLEEMAALFYRTVHTVNAADYTPQQLDAWADGAPDLERWLASFQQHYSLVALEGEKIVGFGDIDQTGYLDRLYVHAEFQHRGIGSALCDRLEAQAAESVTTHASVTARPFFEGRGYRVIRAQQVERYGVWMPNFVMKKELL